MSRSVIRQELRCDFNDGQDSNMVSGFYEKFIVFYFSENRYFSSFCYHLSGCPFMGARRINNTRKCIIYSNCLTNYTAKCNYGK